MASERILAVLGACISHRLGTKVLRVMRLRDLSTCVVVFDNIDPDCTEKAEECVYRPLQAIERAISDSPQAAKEGPWALQTFKEKEKTWEKLHSECEKGGVTPVPRLLWPVSNDCSYSCLRSERPVLLRLLSRRWVACKKSLLACFAMKKTSITGECPMTGSNCGLPLLTQGI